MSESVFEPEYRRIKEKYNLPKFFYGFKKNTINVILGSSGVGKTFWANHFYSNYDVYFEDKKAFPVSLILDNDHFKPFYTEISRACEENLGDRVDYIVDVFRSYLCCLLDFLIGLLGKNGDSMPIGKYLLLQKDYQKQKDKKFKNILKNETFTNHGDFFKKINTLERVVKKSFGENCEIHLIVDEGQEVKKYFKKNPQHKKFIWRVYPFGTNFLNDWKKNPDCTYFMKGENDVYLLNGCFPALSKFFQEVVNVKKKEKTGFDMMILLGTGVGLYEFGRLGSGGGSKSSEVSEKEYKERVHNFAIFLHNFDLGEYRNHYLVPNKKEIDFKITPSGLGEKGENFVEWWNFCFGERGKFPHVRARVLVYSFKSYYNSCGKKSFAENIVYIKDMFEERFKTNKVFLDVERMMKYLADAIIDMGMGSTNLPIKSPYWDFTTLMLSGFKSLGNEKYDIAIDAEELCSIETILKFFVDNRNDSSTILEDFFEKDKAKTVMNEILLLKTDSYDVCLKFTFNRDNDDFVFSFLYFVNVLAKKIKCGLMILFPNFPKFCLILLKGKLGIIKSLEKESEFKAVAFFLFLEDNNIFERYCIDTINFSFTSSEIVKKMKNFIPFGKLHSMEVNIECIGNPTQFSKLKNKKIHSYLLSEQRKRNGKTPH